jgi:hypothetical protein
VIDAIDEFDAVAITHVLKINPGGEAAILEMPEGMNASEHAEMLSYKDRLVTKEELVANGAKRMADLPEYMQDRFEEEAVKICDECSGDFDE